MTRAPSEPFARATELRASAHDTDSAASVMRRVYDELTVETPRSQSIALDLRSLHLSSAKVASLKISDSAVTTAPYPFYTVVTNRTGQMRTSVEGRSTVLGSRQMAVTTPGRPVRVDYTGPATHINTVVIARQALEDELSAMLDRPVSRPVDFGFEAVSTIGDSPFQLAMATLRHELSLEHGLLRHPVLGSHMTRMLMSGLLLGHPHSWSDELLRPAASGGPKAIRLVVEAVERDPMAFATVADLARVASLSVRSLEEGFRRFHNCPPMRYVRGVRLARAHEDLTAASFGATTATAIAQRWGFSHYGRFANEYRRRYGTTPTDTLRR